MNIILPISIEPAVSTPIKLTDYKQIICGFIHDLKKFFENRENYDLSKDRELERKLSLLHPTPLYETREPLSNIKLSAEKCEIIFSIIKEQPQCMIVPNEITYNRRLNTTFLTLTLTLNMNDGIKPQDLMAFKKRVNIDHLDYFQTSSPIKLLAISKASITCLNQIAARAYSLNLPSLDFKFTNLMKVVVENKDSENNPDENNPLLHSSQKRKKITVSFLKFFCCGSHS